MRREKPCGNPQCQKPMRNPKFCSSACGAIVSNAERLKSHTPKKYYCPRCGDLVGEGYKNRTKICKNCRTTFVDWSKITLADMFAKLPTYQAHARIRSLSRTSATKVGKTKSCEVCGYDKHVEVCHIKPLADFDPNTTITEVNAIDNLVGLCPNCHWEFDHGMIVLKSCGGQI